MRRGKRSFIGLFFGILLAGLAGPSLAQSPDFFRIGTGGAGGTYYPVGGLLAHAISNPPGSRACEEGGSCGVPGMIAVAQSSNGSVSNLKAIAARTLESGFAQSDIVYWAYTGTGIFKGIIPMERLRVITNLYPESIHLVARPDSGIKSIHDLKGKRVSLDESGSGTLVDARVILEAYGLSEADLKAEYMKPGLAADKMGHGDLDAFFIVAGYPTSSVFRLATTSGAVLIPIDGPEANKVIRNYGFFAPNIIPAGTYSNDKDIKTLSVGAQWIVNSETSDEKVYQITRALWNANSRKLLDNGHPKARSITLPSALAGIGIPLHPGAIRYYEEIGLID